MAIPLYVMAITIYVMAITIYVTGDNNICNAPLRR